MTDWTIEDELFTRLDVARAAWLNAERRLEVTDKAYQEMQAERTYLISRIDELEELVETLSEKLAECAASLGKCAERNGCNAEKVT